MSIFFYLFFYNIIMFGSRIRELRKERKLSQKQLAEILNVDFRTVSFWETERYEPNLQQLESICRYFEVSADYLIGLKDFY